MAFTGTLIPIASPHGVAVRVHSHRNAGKSSWRRAALNRVNRLSEVVKTVS